MELAKTTLLKKYPAYKDSGVDWLGAIPEDWNVVALGSLVELKSDKNHPDFDVLSVYRDYGVIKKDSRDDNHNATSLDTTNYKAIEPGDLVVNKMKAWQGSMGISSYKGIVSPAYITCRITSKQIDHAFLHRLLRCNLYIGEYNRISYGVRVGQWDMHYEDFKKVPVLILPIDEQTHITTFLDDKCEKIDRAIAQKQKLIELLKERLQIIIQNAVTKGLNPNAKMKDSSVEWIGEIPEHWEILPGLRFFLENKRKNKGMKESTVLSLSYGNIIIKPKEKLVGLVPESFETYQIVEPGDIIIRCTDLQNDQTSLRTGLAKDKGIITSAYLNLKVKGDNASEFLHAFLHFLDTTKVLYKFGSGLRQNLSFFDFKRMCIPQVPVQEQYEILKYIEIQSNKIENSINLQKKQINKLREYKATLIDSAVLGKIKVS